MTFFIEKSTNHEIVNRPRTILSQINSSGLPVTLNQREVSHIFEMGDRPEAACEDHKSTGPENDIR